MASEPRIKVVFKGKVKYMNFSEYSRRLEDGEDIREFLTGTDKEPETTKPPRGYNNVLWNE
jgi:hypothetical protein